MAPANERRVSHRQKFFGIDFTFPVPWLITLVVLGLIQFGIFTQEFADFRKEVLEVKNLLKAAVDISNISAQRNLLQDARLDEHERRISRNEELIYENSKRIGAVKNK